MTISFNQIPVNLRTPGFYGEFDNSKAILGLVTEPSRVLMFGQMRSTGMATPLAVVPVTNGDAANVLFGQGSMLADMVKAFRKYNRYSELVVLPMLDNAAGAAATAELAVSGPATAAGTLNLYITGKPVQVAVTSGMTAAQLATAIAAAITALADLPCTAAVDGVDDTQVNLTARHKGECGNDIDIRLNYYGEATPAGTGVTITAFSGGSGNPDISDAIDVLTDTQYRYAICPWRDSSNIVAVVAEFEDRWSGMRQIEGSVFVAHPGNHAALTTYGNGRNSEVLSVLPNYKSPTAPWAVASILAAEVVPSLDNDPARPVQTIELRGMLAPAEEDRFTQAERNLLLYDGISTFTVTRDGRVLIERLITTYQTNSFGLADPSYLDIETMATLATLRYTLRARLSQKFPRSKLANDGTNFAPGQDIVTPSIIRAELIALAREWELRGWVEDLDQYKDDLLVERDADDVNRVNAIVPPNIINQLRVFAAKIQFRL